MRSIETAKAGVRFFLLRVLRMPERWIRFLKLPRVAASLFLKRPLAQRSDLPVLLVALGLKGRGAEVGVGSGQYSEAILKYSDLSQLYSVDQWREMDEVTYADGANVTQGAQEEKFRSTQRVLASYGDRSTIMRMSSVEAAEKFQDGAMDFVYIDANHSYEECLQDLTAWWPKVRTGGVFAGHDYLDGEFPFAVFGVKKAVDEFASRTGQRVSVTREREWPSWYLIKGHCAGR